MRRLRASLELMANDAGARSAGIVLIFSKSRHRASLARVLLSLGETCLPADVPPFVIGQQVVVVELTATVVVDRDVVRVEVVRQPGQRGEDLEPTGFGLQRLEDAGRLSQMIRTEIATWCFRVT